MPITLKRIVLSPVWLVRLLKLKRMAKKYKKGKIELTPQFRNNLILKYAIKALKMHNVEIEIQGKENIPNKGGCLIIANHVSNSDSFLLFKALQENLETKDDPRKILTFLAKTELQENWVSRSVLNLIDTFFIDRLKPRESLKTIDAFGNFVKENKTYGVIFPEGTRTQDGNIQEFKAGAFRVARKMFLPIVPVTINNSGEVFDSKRKGKLKVEVIFHPTIKPSTFSAQTNEAIADRTKNVILTKHKVSTPERKKK
ncbi:lysophospholipid acyltransferase family protein [Mycoplasma procyoni]|uniref:lysophospholipid acyltransferase family protein n=1 Tax=Mycoplasma procyoni TaxID=568784 RepID=UPI00197B1C6E|nr:lysophospholipid acyltransferase family protein [Mycoplasma procyoni]MBN3534419.1 1-acyl-sn-glycerol-3-phosphate acyltransferase [Mycoplasma procyoni]